MSHLGVNLSKLVQNLFAKNYKMLMKNIKEDLYKWRYAIFKDLKTNSKNVKCAQIGMQVSFLSKSQKEYL